MAGGSLARLVAGLLLVAGVAAAWIYWPPPVDDLAAAVAAIEENDAEKAMHHVERGLSARDLPNERKAALLRKRGRIHEHRNDLDAALADYDASIKLDASIDEAFARRGVVHGSKGRYDQAIADFTQALLLNRDDPATYFHRGLTYHNQRQWERAIRDYSAALDLRPEYREALQGRALAQMVRLAGPQRPLTDYNKLVHLGPDRPWAYHGRGFLKLLSGDDDHGATEDMRKALDLESDNVHFMLGYHMARYEEGLADGAELRRLAGKIDLRTWPGILVALYLDEASAAQVRATGSRRDWRARCETAYHIAERELMRGENARLVRELYLEAMGDCPPTSIYYVAALAGSVRMRKALSAR